MKKYICFTFLTILLATGSIATELQVGTGLEVDDYKKLDLIVDFINQEKENVSLTEDDIAERVKLIAQNGGIQVNAANETSSHLHVNILVVRNGFNVTVKFNRHVQYSALNNQYNMMATVWNKSISGTGGNNNYLLSSLDKLLIELLTEYIKVNQE